MKKHLEIIVTINWCHGFFGRHRIDGKRFSMENAVEAEKYFFEKSADDGIYQHTIIQIVDVIDE